MQAQMASNDWWSNESSFNSYPIQIINVVHLLARASSVSTSNKLIEGTTTTTVAIIDSL